MFAEIFVVMEDLSYHLVLIAHGNTYNNAMLV